jgi:hypothetical protein
VAAHSPYGDLVVKAMVHTNGGEAQALRAWAAARLPVPDVVASGRAPNGAAYLATRRISGISPDVGDRFEEIASTLHRMHATPPPHDVAHPCVDGTDVLSGWALRTLADHGHPTGRLRTGIGRLLADPGDTLVHGDIKASNLIETPTGEIVVIDPHGLRDHPERDLASLLLAASPDCDRDLGILSRRLRACYGPHDRDRLARWVGGYLTLRAALAAWQDREPVRPLLARADKLLHVGARRAAA